MLCAVDYIFNLLCAFNCLQPMKKFVFSVASRATGRLQIRPSGTGDENAGIQETEARALVRMSCGFCALSRALRWVLTTGVPNSVGVRWHFVGECMKINKIRP